MNGNARLSGNHVSFNTENIEIIPQKNWTGPKKKRMCEWNTLDLKIDSQKLRNEIQVASEAVSDPWKDLGMQAGLSIWRVTKYRATKWPKEEYGNFYDADAFIVLNTSSTARNSDIPEYDVHIWVGKFAQKEEYEAVLVKCLELDWKLGYEGMIHREVQSRESDLFKSYFKPMTIWKGDAESRLRSLKGETYPARLLRYYKPSIRRPFTCMKEVPIQRQYLDSDLIFVMDIGHVIYQWNGADCQPEEKPEVLEYCQKLRAVRGMKCEYEMIEENQSADHYFNFYLYDSEDSTSLLDSDDETNVQVSWLSTLSHVHKPKLVQVDIHGTNVSFKVIKEGKIVEEDVRKQKVCILDLAYACFVWISAQAFPQKRLALQYAHEYLKNTESPLIPVTVVKEGQSVHEFYRALGQLEQNGH